MDDHPDHPTNDHDDDEIEIEAYCVRCRERVMMLNPTPVWTRRGAPGMRGECDMCGSTVFRMGRTAAHAQAPAPNMKRLRRIAESTRRAGPLQPKCGAFINYTAGDIYFATRLAEDLERTGIPTWFDPNTRPDEVAWATGHNPGLEECSHMVVILSGAALDDERARQSWEIFKGQRKAVVVAQIAPCDIPDTLRRSPRFDFALDYTTALRELVQALSS